MNRIFLAALLLGASFAAIAGDNNSQSVSTAVTNSSSGAQAATGDINFNSITPENSTAEVTYKGSYDVRSAPGVVLGGFSGSFSSDSCTSTTQGGASWLGGSLAFGKPVRDLNCERMRWVERAGQLGSSAPPVGAPVEARRAHAAAWWVMCQADIEGVLDTCKALGLVGENGDAWK